MKRLFLLVMLIFALASTAFAAGAKDSVQSKSSVKPVVAVMYVNNAKTKFDEAIDQSVLANLAKCITPTKYDYIDGKPYVEMLNKMGIVDISTAERSDIVDCLSGENVDYVVFVEVQPMHRKEKIHFFNRGIEMTTQIPLKIIDVVNNKYLYNGKFTENGSDETVIGGLGNKSPALKAIDKANKQIEIVLATRLPAAKPVAKAAAK